MIGASCSVDSICRACPIYDQGFLNVAYQGATLAHPSLDFNVFAVLLSLECRRALCSPESTPDQASLSISGGRVNEKAEIVVRNRLTAQFAVLRSTKT